jgi:hypothetical protein
MYCRSFLYIPFAGGMYIHYACRHGVMEMIPTIDLRNQAMALLAADPTTLAPAALAIKIKLAQNNFAPSEQSAIGDFTEATFPGYTDIPCVVGTQPEGLDPTSLDSLIYLKGPAGGFQYLTTGPWVADQTVYGYYLVDNAGTTLYASQLFPAPITLTGSGQILDIGDPNLRLVAGSIS